VREAPDGDVASVDVGQHARAVVPGCDRAYVIGRDRIFRCVNATGFDGRPGDIEDVYLWAGDDGFDARSDPGSQMPPRGVPDAD